MKWSLKPITFPNNEAERPQGKNRESESKNSYNDGNEAAKPSARSIFCCISSFSSLSWVSF
jgi:hypothetical protein